ncbi:MAG: SRPBCC family protein [Steroidobacteraceae bacterium]
MADIIHELTVKSVPARVFHSMATPQGLTQWWAQSCTGKAHEGAEYLLGFGPEYQWRGRVTHYVPDAQFELEITTAHPDWTNTRVGCELRPEGRESTRVRFYHIGWPAENEHWRVSCYCWAMYLRVMRRFLEHGEVVPYERRLEV